MKKKFKEGGSVQEHKVEGITKVCRLPQRPKGQLAVSVSYFLLEVALFSFEPYTKLLPFLVADPHNRIFCC